MRGGGYKIMRARHVRGLKPLISNPPPQGLTFGESEGAGKIHGPSNHME